MEDEITQGITWDAPYFFLESQKFTPLIYDSPYLGAPVPSGYNAVKITLDGKMTSHLDWELVRKAAHEYVEKGIYLFWDFELGLFSDLTFPLSDSSQYLALVLAVEYFRDSFWQEFQPFTIGLCLYRGDSDFSFGFEWDEKQELSFQEWIQEIFFDLEDLRKETGISLSSFERFTHQEFSVNDEGRRLVSLFCRNACVEYLELLANRLPDALQLFIALETLVKDPLTEALLLSKERYDRFHLAIRGGILEHQGFEWSKEGVFCYKDLSSISIGICLPPMDMYRPSQYAQLQDAMQKMMEGKIKFRLIPEESLITQWDGLDYLVVAACGLSSQGMRKLQGFCAAGGTVVVLGSSLGLVNEISFLEWQQNKFSQSGV